MSQAAMPSPGLTVRAASFAVDDSLRFPADALDIARLSVYDCLAVAIAGEQEPVSRAVRELVRSESGAPQSGAFGLAQRVPARAAALLNGAVAHALDYDDTHFDFVGHPSVAVLPAALAVAEHRQAGGRALLEAFLTGVEVTCRVGGWLGRPHYNAGFHQTATSGAFGAAAAAARLLGLDAERAAHALGLAATRASGLKCQFGTMAKPFHAGMAASTGVEAAMLAAQGFIARPDAIECAGGFASTHGAPQGCMDDPFAGLPEAFRFVDVQYKFHACCHGTHPALEALKTLCARHGLQAGDIGTVSLTIAPQWLPVCCIAEPATGLEAKFSLSLTAAMVLAGVDTAALASFSDANCRAPALTELARRVEVHPDPAVADTACRATIVTKSGVSLDSRIELSDPLPYETRSAKLRNKADALLGSQRAEALWDFVETLDNQPAADLYPRLHTWMAGAAA
ncbi:MmgE/PrpD family protein [Cupriavidus oxalaticus]|uniref:MmgE/PrpD family protein n=1 Tax=Cupriavidus oxalaticus TaxID=96344 RepID=UPI0031701133